MSDYLPLDIQINILSRLPPESLLRFRCVCKSWRSLITTPSFIATHLNRTTTNKLAQKLLFTRYKSSPSRTEQISLRFDSDSFTGYSRFKCPFEAKVYFRVVGTCNGLVCLSDDRFGYTYNCFIWNPAIHRYLSLPKPSFNIKNSGPYMFVLGFGFDVKKNDYKVVRLAYLEQKNYVNERRDSYHATPKVEIFSASTCSWRTMKRGAPQVGVIESIWTQVYLNGSVHWSAYKKEENCLKNVVLLFDIAEEKFRVMGFPSVLDYASPENFTVGLHKDSLALFAYDSRRHCTSFAVYVMKKYGVVDSWCALYVIGDIMGGISTVPGFREDGELLVVTKANELVSYDPKSKGTKKLGIRGVRDSVYVGAYAESLVLLNGLKGRLASQVKSYKKSVPATEQWRKWREMDESKIEKHVDVQYAHAVGSLPLTANSGVDYENLDEDTAADLLIMADIAGELLSK